MFLFLSTRTLIEGKDIHIIIHIRRRGVGGADHQAIGAGERQQHRTVLDRGDADPAVRVARGRKRARLAEWEAAERAALQEQPLEPGLP